MRRTAGKTHTLYPEIQWHKHAQADCYRCGTRERAHRMLWLEHSQAKGYVALCPACSTTHTANSSVPPETAVAARPA